MISFRQSMILSLITAVWDWVIGLYKRSFVSRIVGYVWLYCKRGFLYGLFHREGRLERVWRRSLFFRALDWIFNLVPNLLSGLFERRAALFDGSFFCRLLRVLGRNTAYYMGAYLLIILVVPYGIWNNMYSLIFSLAGLALFWCAGLRDRRFRIDLAHIGPWPTLFAALTCLSLLWSQDFPVSLRFLFFALTCILTVVVLVSSVKTEKQLLVIIELLALGLLLCSLYGLYQSYVGVKESSSFTDLDANAGMPGRIFSFFQNPNAFANLLVYFIPLMVAMIFYSPTWREKLFFFGVTGISCVALLLTFSRGGWFSLAIALFILALFLCPRWVPLFIILVALAIPFLPASIKARVLTIFSGDTSISSRNYIYSAVVRLLQNNWFFGVGLGTSALKRGIAYYDTFHTYFPFVHAHNILLEIWAESGIFAAVSFVCAMCASFARGLAARKRAKTPLTKAIVSGSLAGLAGSMIFGLTDYAWSFPRVMVLFWFLFAILYAAIKLTKNNETTEKAGTIHG